MSKYIGKRIVPRHDGEWDCEKEYEMLSIVFLPDSGVSYIARKTVPAGIDITDTEYWALCSQFSSQVEEVEKELSDVEKNIALLNTRLDANVTASTDANADYAAEVVDARVDADGTTHESLGDAIRYIYPALYEDIHNAKAYEAHLPVVSAKTFYDLAQSKSKTYFESSYDGQNDALTLTCIQDYEKDYILYATVTTAREYAQLYRMGKKMLLKYKTANVSNPNRAFKMSIYYQARPDADSRTNSGSIASAPYTHVFQDGEESVEDAISIVKASFDYDDELGCYTKNGKPMALSLLLYANSAKAGDTITLYGFGNILHGVGEDAYLNGLQTNMLRAEVKELAELEASDIAALKTVDEKAAASLEAEVEERKEADSAALTRIDSVYYNDRMDCQIYDFATTKVFAPSHSTYEITVDEYGDESYLMTYVDNNPMYQMELTDLVGTEAGVVIVEFTARRVAGEGKLRIQLYNSSTGYNYSEEGASNAVSEITESYRRFQRKIVRRASGPIYLGIGPTKTEGLSVQFKDVKVLIPNEFSKQIEKPMKYFCGYPDPVDFTALTPVTLENPRILGTDDYAPKDGLYLDSLEIYSPVTKTTLTCYVGCIDQYGLLQTLSSFYINIPKGGTVYRVDDKDISVPAGYGIFVKWDTTMPVYEGMPKWGFHDLVSSDDNYYENEQGYSGYPLTESEYMVPMRYTLRDQCFRQEFSGIQSSVSSLKETSDNMAEKLDELEAEVQEQSGIKPTVTLIDPDGVKCSLSVNSDGTLTAIRSIPKKAVVFGNSLTLGFGTFGMAASDSKHDWFYYVNQYLLGLYPDLAMTRASASSWEGMTDSESRTEYVKDTLIAKYTDGTEDLIVIQLSDNVNTAEKRATFPNDAVTIISLFRSACPKARIVWIAAWYGWTTNMTYVQAACEKLDVDLVDITDLSLVSDNKSAIGNIYTKDDGTEVEITSTGVASHPGDTGMKLIADRVIEKLESHM